MIKKGFKGRCQKRQMKKCKEVVRTYGAIQLAYAERLEQEDSIIEFQCNVMLSGLEAGEYSSDFVCEKQNGQGVCGTEILKEANDCEVTGCIKGVLDKTGYHRLGDCDR